MPFNTALTRKLGIASKPIKRPDSILYTDLSSVPVVQGGMQWVGYAELASAVSNAGGLGIVRPPATLASGHTANPSAHGPHTAHPRRPAQGDSKVPVHDQEPLCREPDSPPGPRAPGLQRLRAGGHRRRDQDRRNGR